MQSDEDFQKNFLIDFLIYFYNEYGRQPNKDELDILKGFPSINIYINIFGSWENALKEAYGIQEENKIICDVCGRKINKNKIYEICSLKLCKSCYKNTEVEKSVKYNKNLNIIDRFDFKRIGELIVLKHFGIEDKILSSNKGNDFIHKEMGIVRIKNASENQRDDCVNNWMFNIRTKNQPNTYIFLGFSADKKSIKHVWIIPYKADYPKCFNISNSEKKLKEFKQFEVDAKPYNDIYKSMIE